MTGIAYSRNGLRYSGAMESAARKKAASSSSVNMCGRLRTGLAIHADGTMNPSAPVSWRYLPNSRIARVRYYPQVPVAVPLHHAVASSRVSTVSPG